MSADFKAGAAGLAEDYAVKSSETLYKGKIFDVIHDEIKLPNGKTAARETVVHAGGAAVLPVDGDGHLYFVRQYRCAAKNLMLEVCAGMLEPGETPEQCALRELTEEIGFRAGKIRQICGSFYGAVGFCTERTHLYIAEDLTPCRRNLDPEELIDVEKYTIREAVALVESGRIIDSKTIIAILALKSGF